MNGYDKSPVRSTDLFAQPSFFRGFAGVLGGIFGGTHAYNYRATNAAADRDSLDRDLLVIGSHLCDATRTLRG